MPTGSPFQPAAPPLPKINGRPIYDLHHTFAIHVVTSNDDHELVSSLLVAILLGLGAAIISNRDVLHEILRHFNVTRETSYPSEWYSAFSRHHDCYVVLHLNGERRLFGWPEEWPSRPETGLTGSVWSELTRIAETGLTRGAAGAHSDPRTHG